MGMIYLIMAFKNWNVDGQNDVCLISSKYSNSLVVTIVILILTLITISSAIFIGIVLLIYLHIKLTKYDFTTYEYIHYKIDRKDRLYRLRHKTMTKERFNELEKKALSKSTKKRSKIIKEVNEDNENKILEKIRLRHNIRQEVEQDDEESKTNQNSGSNLKNNQNETKACNNRNQNTDNNSMSQADIFDNVQQKEYELDENVKKSNNF